VSKVTLFGYNRGMNWVRKGFVSLLAFLLLISLLWGVSSYNVHTKLSHPDKVKTWVASSGLYDHLVNAALAQAQTNSTQNGTAVSVAYNDPAVSSAAKAALPKELIESSTNKFIDANYAWLSGKTSKPQFNIDLTKAKQDFANGVGKQVADHLKTLPACTPDQLAKIQIPVNPLTVTCRPGSLDPQTEGNRVATEVMSNSDFLNNPVLTADNLGQAKDKPANPYYQQLSALPQIYQVGQNLVWICLLLVLILE
jgi:hypothetical protein